MIDKEYKRADYARKEDYRNAVREAVFATVIDRDKLREDLIKVARSEVGEAVRIMINSIEVKDLMKECMMEVLQEGIKGIGAKRFIEDKMKRRLTELANKTVDDNILVKIKEGGDWS